MATVLAALIHGDDRNEVLSPQWKSLQKLSNINQLHPLIHEIAQGSVRQKQPPAIQGSLEKILRGCNPPFLEQLFRGHNQ